MIPTVEEGLLRAIESHFEEWGRLPEAIHLGFWPWRTLLDEIWPKLKRVDHGGANSNYLELSGVPIRHFEDLDPDTIMVIR